MGLFNKIFGKNSSDKPQKNIDSNENIENEVLKETTLSNSELKIVTEASVDEVPFKKVLQIENDITRINNSFIHYFENWKGENYVDLDFIQSNFRPFCNSFHLKNLLSEEENNTRFKTGEIVGVKSEMLTHPYCGKDELKLLKSLTTSTYSEDDLKDLSSYIDLMNFDSFSSYPIHDELSNQESKVSLRSYFHSIEAAFIKYIYSNSKQHQEFLFAIKEIVSQIKLKFGETEFQLPIVRDDLYNMLLNIIKMLDEAESVLNELNDCLEVPMYKNHYRDNTNEVTGFEFLGTFSEKFEGKLIDGKWYDGFKKTSAYWFYCFKSQSKNKERLFLGFERNLVKITDLMINSLTLFELILSEYNDENAYNKYLMFRIDIEKHGLILSHFEGTILSKIDDVNFNFKELKEILVRNNIELIESVERLNENLGNLGSGLNIIGSKLAEVGNRINILDKTSRWNNMYTVANLYYNYKTYKLLQK